MMQKFFQLVIVFSLALIATNGAASQDLLEADPSIVHTEIPAKMGLAGPVAANDDTWTSAGPIGGYVTCLAIAPSDFWLPLIYGTGYIAILLITAIAIFDRRDFR